MKLVTRFLALSFIAVSTLTCSDTLTPVSARDQACFDKPGQISGRPTTTPIALACVIAVPGSPILSGTKSWVYPVTKRFYETDVSNAGVDVIDLKGDTVVTRITGFVGATGVAATSGPNSIVFVPGNRAWVSDGNSDVKIIDLSNNSTITDISTAIGLCDGGTPTTHFCQRTNEITYDPEDNVIVVQNPSPLAVAAPHAAIDTYMSFISATAPYTVLGTITFTGSFNQEAPLWDPGLHRILTAVSGVVNGAGTALTVKQYVAVIDPKVFPYVIERKITLDCSVIRNVPGSVALGINDPSLGPSENVIIPGCNHVIFNATTGAVITAIAQLGGGNETWYNPGDKRFYVTGLDSVANSGLAALGVVDAQTNTWLQNVPAAGITNPTADPVTNQIFGVVQVSAAQAAAPATDNTACTIMGVKGTGCIAVYVHAMQ